MNLLNKLRNPFVLAGQGFLMGGALFLANPPVVDPGLARLVVRQMRLQSRPSLIRQPELIAHVFPPCRPDPNPKEIS